MTTPSPPVRFIILARGRTGSTFLHQLLDSHPGCVCFEEIFAGRNLPPLPSKYPSALREDIMANEHLRAVSPGEFLSRFVYPDYGPTIHAVGFKLFYFHSREGAAAGIWNALRADPSLRVVHLGRRNVLRMFTSMKIAHKTGAWWSLDGKPGLDEKKVTIDAEEFAAYVNSLEADRLWGDQVFEGHPLLHVDYEEFEGYGNGDRAAIDRVLEFLGLPPGVLETEMQRQNPEPLSDLIDNYATLRSRFEGTPLQRFFEDA
jgi:LPS sulfotransferase NodH